MQDKQILVVEDEKDILELVSFNSTARKSGNLIFYVEQKLLQFAIFQYPENAL